MTEGNGRSGDHGEPAAIIGVACRFPGARDPAEFHDLNVTGRRMFQSTSVLPERPLRAALLDDWTVPPDTHSDYLGQAQPGPGQLDEARPDLAQVDPGQLDPGPVLKLATEMTALALTDAGLREAAGNSRTGPSPRCSPPGPSPIWRPIWDSPGRPGPAARWPAGPYRGCGRRSRSPRRVRLVSPLAG